MFGLSLSVDAQNSVGHHKIKKIVIDPGHGGKDSGTCGKNICEKKVVLSVALALGKMIKDKFPDIEVVYTRTKDVYVELHERGNIANRHKADLFISIHADGEPSHKARGASTWVMGLKKTEANRAVSLRENSVITMESDYKSKYEGYDPKSPESFIMFSLLQNAHLEESVSLASFVQTEMVKNGPIKGNRGVRQDVFLVLWKTAMPSILVELGFLTTPSEEKFLTDKASQTQIVTNIFNGICQYKAQYERGASSGIFEEKLLSAAEDNLTVEHDDGVSPEVVAGVKYYGVQIMSGSKNLTSTSSAFKGHKNVKKLKSDKLYKYVIPAKDLKAAKSLSKSLQKDFKGAFVVSVQGNIVNIVK